MVNCQLYPPSESSLTDIETGPSSDCGALQPLRRNPTISSIVPETPRTDSSSSFLPPPDPVRESHLKISQTDLPRRAALPTNPHVGTPSVVGAIHKSNGFLPIATPAVARGPSSLPRSFAMDISMKPLITGYADPTDSEFNETDAQFVLELASISKSPILAQLHSRSANYSMMYSNSQPPGSLHSKAQQGHIEPLSVTLQSSSGSHTVERDYSDSLTFTTEYSNSE
ncbi:hypothetical protein EV363DRAFT_1180939 [Boletus edulis]|nr:hypothetical protein EV363DRAFT_1180939 [Boletus edulis]